MPKCSKQLYIAMHSGGGHTEAAGCPQTVSKTWRVQPIAANIAGLLGREHAHPGKFDDAHPYYVPNDMQRNCITREVPQLLAND
jgi:hypothetical protein